MVGARAGVHGELWSVPSSVPHGPTRQARSLEKTDCSSPVRRSPDQHGAHRHGQ